MGERSALGDEVDCYNVDRVILDDDAIVSQQAFLCTATHDITDPGRKLITAPIRLKRMSWVCVGAFVYPGVTLGEGAVASARAVVTRDVAPWAVVAGNPAVFVKRRVLAGEAALAGTTDPG